MEILSNDGQVKRPDSLIVLHEIEFYMMCLSPLTESKTNLSESILTALY